jgi:hypothetical protein
MHLRMPIVGALDDDRLAQRGARQSIKRELGRQKIALIPNINPGQKAVGE